MMTSQVKNLQHHSHCLSKNALQNVNKDALYIAYIKF